jgi:eukaryotic-like serine/threonine-protein kinase
VPTQIGKYQLRRLLGEGASGKVYLALDTFSGEDVALKVIDQERLRDPKLRDSTRRQFMSEASLAGKLAHPHIVSIFEAVLQDDAGYVAMEYVPGGNLLKFTAPGNLLPVEDVIQIGFKSCSALDYAFRQGIVHRDLKPANILVKEGVNIKVADFGAALLQSVESTQQWVLGTPGYMSPEQIMGGALTLHSDMYTMGVVLYELLTGRRPFISSDMEELFKKIRQREPVRPSAIRSSLPEKLDPILLRLLSKRPEDRYPTWADLGLEIAQVGKLSVYQRDIPDSEKFGFLRSSAFFQHINDAQIWELVQASRWNRFPAGHAIHREDEPGQSLFYLAAGYVKVTKRGRLLNVLRTGECFGEMAYIRREAELRQATVESMADVLVAEFDNAALARMSEACRLEIAHGLLRLLAERLALANERVAQPA